MKTEADVVDIMELATSVDLPEKASSALRLLRDAMYPTAALHNAEFRELEELHKLQHEEFI